MKVRHLFASLALLAVWALALTPGLGAGDKDKKEDKKAVKKGDKKDGDDFPFPIPMPGPEHKELAKLAGTFDAKVKMMDPKGGDSIESKGTMKRAMILGGRYLKEDFTGEAFGKKFQGMALIAFDTNKKKFVTNWIDSMSTGFMSAEGTWDEASKTLTCHGEGDVGGMKFKTKDILKVVSPDEQHMEMYKSFEGKEMKVMEIVFTRAKEVKKVKKDK